MSSKVISIRGARTHNLKNVSVDVPHRQLTVVTGPSGSGKSSLAFDTLYAEGQRRFVESMSTYVRQFLERMERPDVDFIDGILPALAIEQKNSVKNARSTVATATELADYIRLFMTYCGETFCPTCGTKVARETAESVTRTVMETLNGARVAVLAPLFFSEETRNAVLQQLVKGGYYRIWLDGAVADLKEIDVSGLDSVDVVLGRFRISASSREQIADSIEQAFSLTGGLIHVLEEAPEGWSSHRYYASFSCNHCGDEFPEPTPHLFSFNSPLGACGDCQGYGRIIGIDMDKVIPVRSQRLDELPITPWNSPGYEDCYEDLEAAAKKHKLRLDVPIDDLTETEWDILYSGRGKWYGIKGFFEWLDTKKYKIHVRVMLARFRNYTTCQTCDGSRIGPAGRNVRFRQLTVADLFAMHVGEARHFWEYLPLTREEEKIAGHLRREILNRLVYLDEVGLTYLTLDRQTRTLSGGESQRINLASALGSSLTETLYVIDEPTVGLHARDSERLLSVLRRLRNGGNTVVVVEHDPTVIAGGDYIVELGPGAGELGGRVLFAGSADTWTSPDSDNPPDSLPEAESSASDESHSITVVGAREHNLTDIDVSIPLNRLVAITGVSGSGKTTLIRDCLFNGYQRVFRGISKLDIGKFTRIEGVEHVDDIQFVDQSPIGRSSRSNPATYIKAWDEIRKLLAGSASAKLNGVTPGMFSFNTTGGRCATCEGAGFVIIDMQFLADVEVVCDTCGGRRFNEKVMKVMYKNRNVDAILKMTVDEALRFFIDKRAVVRKLDALRSVGLGYLQLGQSTASLSGGEAQRLKLASFLVGEKNMTRRLFLFDEPTTGLHSSDVRQLITTLRDLVERGNSVVVIEHNLQLIEACDHVIDLGPDGGDGGGQLVAEGTPREVAANLRSITGRFLFARPSEEFDPSRAEPLDVSS
ncbi:MAG TPA: excinuclease ABC subunit UvrA [Thermoanaerobaculia bacterium]|nr:excinuclease ABC subunit UvrA [Thermoanaerobaculia bacterium]